ncbi:MAG TPA: tRNA (adenosine(37)-N6)-threonylcarbamoyltransferase complex transferase subunit TsaD [Bacteroidales bacterium]|mgnify:CR=1 FL=1|jgi:N6-L-threonylcarbamoyladenine synthase|nr:tRNA (adenosine(37)-N6)-threonylcarbamoyltransferase complex transferase subunit TsaD [Bacteroidales bacterium]
MNITILAIESSCDDTSAAVIQNGLILSNIIANQSVHQEYGGVVPELASRSHQQNIVPVVEKALKQAGVSKQDITAVAFTRGPGLLGSLLVGTSFAKGFALAHQCKLIEVNHLHAHVLASFIQTPTERIAEPQFPFLSLLVSGGHTQIIIAHSYTNMEIIGTTIDDAAGEAFDKCAKVLGLPYPGGPHIDNHAQKGNPLAYSFNKPSIPDFDFSFSGLKTSVLYFLRDQIKQNPEFISQNIDDICASLQKTIIDILMQKLHAAVKHTGIREIAIGGGVAANSGLRNAIAEFGKKYGYNTYIPERKYTTDNAAMIAITAYHKYLAQDFASQDISPRARYSLQEYFGKI